MVLHSSSDAPLRIVVVDDSALYRQLIRNVLRDLPGVDVVGTATSGEDALRQVDELSPDLFTLDVRMPGLDGIEVLRELKRRKSPTKAIMVSSLTATGAQVTTDALLEGAFDFILKPSGPDAAGNRESLRAALAEKIDAFRGGGSRRAGRRLPSTTPRPMAESPTTAGVPVATAASLARPADAPRVRAGTAGSGFDAVVIGTSTGGPAALRQLLPALPGNLPVPILIVQHMPPQYTHSLAQRLNEASEIEVVEACDGMTLEPGWAFIAPGGRQMKVAQQGLRRVVRITDDPPENSCRPSADYLFRSAGDVFGNRVLALVMTGMGRDGMEGCRELKRRGAYVIAQDADTCDVYGMPKAVVDEKLADQQVPLPDLAGLLVGKVTGRP